MLSWEERDLDSSKGWYLRANPLLGLGEKRLRIAYSIDFVPSVSATKENAPRIFLDGRNRDSSLVAENQVPQTFLSPSMFLIFAASLSLPLLLRGSEVHMSASSWSRGRRRTPRWWRWIENRHE